MKLDPTTFEYLKPTDAQVNRMARARMAVRKCAEELIDALPDGPDKTYVIRKLREVAMWANVAITRDADGAPRIDAR